MDLMQKHYHDLVEGLKAAGPSALGFSGGVDSTFLARAMVDALGSQALLILADTPLMPRGEVTSARELAKDLAANLIVLTLDPLSYQAIKNNPADRCYHCKHMIFLALREAANQKGIKILYDGSNKDDLMDYRPGKKAISELGVLSPLEVFTKAEIRQMSAMLGLPTADKPALACLATRFPTNEVLTPDGLKRVEAAEDQLAVLGFFGARVRAHGPVARIEMPQDMRDRLGADGEMMGRVADVVKQTGFLYASLDLSGYKMGSMNGGKERG